MKFFWITTHKNLNGPSSRDTFVNRYLFGRPDDENITSDELQLAAEKCLALEKRASTSDIFINRATISTTQKGDNGELSVKIVSFGQYGAWTVANNSEVLPSTLPLEFVAEYRFAGASGRTGGHQYRGWLTDENTYFSNGTTVVANGPNGAELFGTAIVQDLQALLPLGLMIEGTQNGQKVGRPIETISFAGVNIRQRDRRSAKKVPRSENSLYSRITDFTEDAIEIASAISLLQATGQISQAAKLTAAIATVKSITGGITPPALPAGE